jgi:hypothetical protein
MVMARIGDIPAPKKAAAGSTAVDLLSLGINWPTGLGPNHAPAK